MSFKLKSKKSSKAELIETVSPRPCSTPDCRERSFSLLSQHGFEGVSGWYCDNCIEIKTKDVEICKICKKEKQICNHNEVNKGSRRNRRNSIKRKSK